MELDDLLVILIDDPIAGVQDGFTEVVEISTSTIRQIKIDGDDQLFAQWIQATHGQTGFILNGLDPLGGQFWGIAATMRDLEGLFWPGNTNYIEADQLHSAASSINASRLLAIFAFGVVVNVTNFIGEVSRIARACFSNNDRSNLIASGKRCLHQASASVSS